MQKIGMFILLFLITTVAWAQKISVQGVVADSEGVLPGASVVVKGTETGNIVGTITDFDGNFNLIVDRDAVLVVSFIGYLVKEVPVNGQTVLSIELVSETTQLEDIVVVGYGTQTKASAIASIAQAKGDDMLKTGNVTSVTESLQGMLPGVTSLVSNGKPGDSDALDIMIRGVSSWSSDTDPLVLVDGVERGMDDVDPNEIETVSVLKDASATAVFGVKGGNGVILITTKRGIISDKPQISFSANYGIKTAMVKPEFTDYVTSMNMWNEALINDGQWDYVIPESTISAWENAYETGLVGTTDEFPNVDWWDQVIQPGYQQQYNINVRGGTEFMKYFVSLGYLNDGDIFKTEENDLFDPRFYYKRYNWRANFDLNLTPTSKLSVNLAGSYAHRNSAGYRIDGNSEDGYGQSVFFNTLYTGDQNSFPVKWSNGTWGADDTGAGNMVAILDLGQRMYKYFDGMYDFKFEQDLDFITKGLNASASLSYTTGSNYESTIQRYEGGNFGTENLIRYSRDYDYSTKNADGSYDYTETRWPDDETQDLPTYATYDDILEDGYTRKIYYKAALNYARSFGNHNVSGLALFSREKKTILEDGSTSTFDYEYRSEDWVGRFTYNYKERYLFEVNGAYNGSENFAPGKRFGFFPSVTLGYRLSEEPFIKNLMGDYLNNLKIRYSKGQSGKDGSGQSSRFAYQQNYTSSGSVSFGSTSSTSYGPLYYEDGVANENATWETSTKENLGFEFMLFNKLSGNVDLFREKRTDILMDVWSPLWYNTDDATGNVGETKNHGYEIELSWNQKITSDLRITLGGTYSMSENRMVERGDGVYEEEYLKYAGKPIGYSEAYYILGSYNSIDDVYNFTTPESAANQSYMVIGDYIYADYNADGVIDDQDMVPIDSYTKPLKNYSFSLAAQYKGWSLNAKFYGVYDVYKKAASALIYANNSGSNGIYKTTTDVAAAWYEGTSASALHSDYGSYSQQTSTFTYQNCSYLRLKNIELSYKFSKKVTDQLKIGSLQVYTNGANLITWSDFNENIDPEQSGTSVYPMVKRFNFGVRASF
jgi:TonB-linked SusC/RagA family outer membrane protein